MLVEQDVELFVRSILALWQPKESPQEKHKTRACPEERRLPLPIPSVGVNHVRLNHVADDLTQIIGNAGDADRFVAQAHCTHLGDYGVADWSDREIVAQEPQHDECRLDVTGRAAGSCTGRYCASGEQGGSQKAKSVHVECSASETTEQCPRCYRANGCETQTAYIELEGIRRRQAGVDEKVHRRSAQRRAAPDLSRKSHADDLCAAEVYALEAVEVTCACLGLFFNPDGVLDERDRLIGGCWRILAGKVSNGLTRLVHAAFSHQPPWRFRTEPDDGKNGQWKDPLNGERNAIGSLVGTFGEGLQHACSEKLSESPTQIYVTA